MAAAVVGGLFASAVIKQATGMLASAIQGEVKLHWQFERDLEEMKDTLEAIEAVLQDAEIRSITEKAVQLCLKRLKDAAHDISDMLAELEDKAVKPAAPKVPRLPNATKITMPRRMKKMRRKLKNIADQYNSFGFKQGSTCNGQLRDKRETSSVTEAFIVGRTEEKKKILSCLSDTVTKDITVLPIHGIGGIGKTTMAKMIFADAYFNNYSQVWVYVSQEFDLNKIGNSIISQLSEQESRLTTREMIKTFLEGLVSGKKILVVLDDLWESDPFELYDLKAMLNVGNGSKVIVIVTTRDKDIANRICTVEPYELPLLDGEMCWNIIKQKVDLKAKAMTSDKDDLELVGREIALKCGGVALAAHALGYMLQSMSFDKWVSVRDSDIWSQSTWGDKSNLHHTVIASLMLSYNHMSLYLKSCFAYCATFPKGHKIVKDDLIYNWISLGFIEPPTSMFTSWQHGENYIGHLMEMSFLQYSKAPTSVGVNYDEVTLLTMHDLVHDIAKYVMVDEILDASKQSNAKGGRYRFALLNDCSESLKSFTPSPSKIWALRYLESENNVLTDTSFSSTRYLYFPACGKIGLHDDVFSSAKYLRVLDLSECSIQQLPISICNLKQLRYLKAPKVQHQAIPVGITKLSKLIYLNLCGSSAMLALPNPIGEMESLMYLDLSGCSGIDILPNSFSRLTKLEHLDLSSCCNVTGVSEYLESLTNLQYLNLSFCINIGGLPGAFCSLLKLKYLNLSYCSYLYGQPEAQVLGTLTKLEYLNLSSKGIHIKGLLEALTSLTNLKYLSLRGVIGLGKVPASFGNLKCLIHLDLSFCVDVAGLPKVLDGLTKLQYLNLLGCSNVYANNLKYLRGLENVLCNLTELQYLNLSRCLDIIIDEEGMLEGKFFESPVKKKLFESIYSLSNLEYLNLSNSQYTRQIPEGICNLRKLHTLDLSNCSSLSRIPESIADMGSLKFLSVSGCYKLDESKIPQFNSSSTVSLPRFVVHASDGESGSNLFRLQDVNPPDLEICMLENVKTAEEAGRIWLEEKRSISTLKLGWTRDANRFTEDLNVLGELVPPCNVQEFCLQGYNSKYFPAWLIDAAPHFPNLVKIAIVDLPKCTCLPPLGQLPKLEFLSLEGMHGITKIDEEFCGGIGAFRRLREFTLCRMESLKEWYTTYPCGEDGASKFMFPVLEILEIHQCPMLCLNPCPPEVDIWKIDSSDYVLSSSGARVSCFPVRAKSLSIESSKLPLHQWKFLHHLTSLRYLSIKSCRDLSSSQELTQALSCLQLQILYLKAYDHSDLPNWMSELTSLQILSVSKCESMTSLPEWLRDLTSLRELTIWGCQNLNNLESVGRLVSLQTLCLMDCESIPELPEGLSNVTTLRNLKVHRCEGIKSLPESIYELTKLRTLEITSCPSLLQWCESEENKEKIAHINNKGMGFERPR
ncbi:unnamed protein product [Urochloa decumbens]|uniref:Uncharacterized protein n=1 Tax=Urochloa decumbens TaxID=240449 RepID=A0ABC9BE08_9POAL